MNPAPKYVSRAAVLAGVRRAVRERGTSHVEPRQFYYLDQGWPVCLIGHVFCYQGVTLKDFIATVGPEGNFHPIREVVGVTRPYEYAAFYVEPDALPLLEDAQHYQDEGLTWGEVLAKLEATDDIKEH